MDERVYALNRAVAEAADAWLADPSDVGVYHRLVYAVQARRSYLMPRLEVEEPDGDLVPIPMTVQDEEVLDDLGEGSVQPVGAELAGDVRTVLDRLRRS